MSVVLMGFIMVIELEAHMRVYNHFKFGVAYDLWRSWLGKVTRTYVLKSHFCEVQIVVRRELLKSNLHMTLV